MRPIYVSDYVSTLLFMDRLMGLPWLQVTEARLEYFMSAKDRSYTYGKGVGEREYKSAPFTVPVAYLLGKLNQDGLAYNVCFLNRYDHQKHQLGWHADDSPMMDQKHPIAVISFGAEREIWWKPNDAKGEIPNDQRQLLGSGSLFVMPAGFQELYLHRIPKCDRPCGTRISLTFRKYIDDQTRG